MIHTPTILFHRETRVWVPSHANFPQVKADWHSSRSGGPLELHVKTNNDAVIVSIVAADPEGLLFGGEVKGLLCCCSSAYLAAVSP